MLSEFHYNLLYIITTDYLKLSTYIARMAATNGPAVLALALGCSILTPLFQTLLKQIITGRLA